MRLHYGSKELGTSWTTTILITNKVSFSYVDHKTSGTIQHAVLCNAIAVKHIAMSYVTVTQASQPAGVASKALTLRTALTPTEQNSSRSALSVMAKYPAQSNEDRNEDRLIEVKKIHNVREQGKLMPIQSVPTDGKVSCGSQRRLNMYQQLADLRHVRSRTAGNLASTHRTGT